MTALALAYLGTLAFVAFVLRLRRETTPAERPDLLKRLDELDEVYGETAAKVRDLAETVSELSLKSIGRTK